MKSNKKFKISALAAAFLTSLSAQADIQHLDDVIISFSACIGNDCVNGESFGFDTLRLKENNLRIHFQDTSNSASFPTNDWRLVANDSSNGGLNYFAIEDSSAGRIPFRVEAGAPANALYVEADGDVGIKTSNPVVDLHIVEGNTPTLRLEQDGSDGFTPQTWDVAGNETNFFIRDATNGSPLPFRIMPAAPQNSFVIAADGDIGVGTMTPDADLDIENSTRPTLRLTKNNTNHIELYRDETDGHLHFNTTLDGVTESQAVTFSDDGKVGIGAINPNASLHIEQSNPSILIENTETGSPNKNLLTLQSQGDVQVVFSDSLNEFDWKIANSSGSFHIVNPQGAGQEFTLSTEGHLTTSGTVNGASSRSLKENIVPVDASNVLAQLEKLGVYTWNYIKDGREISHLGPMSEDFHALFGLNGDSDKVISYTDISGVSIAAIKALTEQLKLKNREIENMKSRLTALEKK